MGTEIYKTLVGFEVLMAMTTKSIVFWVIMPCSLESARYIKETYLLHLQGWKQYVPLK
jgi:hypothetical protein